jgi:monovalent cation/hydrogen antiporter
MLWLWIGAVCLVLAGAAIGRRLPFPEAVVWCVLGYAVGFLPGVTGLRLDPHTALFLILPPLVYAASVRLPWPEFRDNLRPIGLLAFGLVLAHTAAAAAIAHYVAGLSWPVAAALGAIVSPTDPAAATAVAARVGLPAKLVAIIEGEGLVNDAVSLTLLRLALAAVAGGFAVGGGVARFFAIVIGESLYGCALAVAVMRLRRRIADPRLEITVSLLTPFAAYLVPESLGGSGILATVAAGMYVGEQMSAYVPAGTRLRGTPVWEVIVFLLNGLLFLMAGVELQGLIRSPRLPAWTLLVAASLIVTRVLWCGAMWLAFRGTRMLDEERTRPMPGRHMTVLAWSGMRGPISLAAALSIPLIARGLAQSDFDAIVLATAVAIAATLIAQGVSLPYLARAVGIPADADEERREDARQLALAESETAKAGIARLAELEPDGAFADLVRRHYEERMSEPGRRDVRLALIEAERTRVRELRREGRINDRAAATLERALDLRESLLP